MSRLDKTAKQDHDGRSLKAVLPKVALATLSFGLFALLGVFANVKGSRPIMSDFPAYYYGAKASLTGLNPYSYPEFSALAFREIGVNPSPYVYPPIFAHILRPLVQGDYVRTQGLWRSYENVSLLLLIACCLWLTLWALPRGGNRTHKWIFAVGTTLLSLALWATPIQANLVLGNINLITTTLSIAAVALAEEKQEPAAGMLLALSIVIKVWSAWFLVLLLIRGRSRACVWTIGVILGISALDAVIFGSADWAHFLRYILENGYGTKPAGIGSNLAWQPGLASLGVRLFGPNPILVRLFVFLSTAGLTGAMVAHRRRLARPSMLASAVLLVSIVSLITPPLVWIAHFSLLMPATCLLLAERTWLPLKRNLATFGGLLALALLFSSPVWGLLQSRLGYREWSISSKSAVALLLLATCFVGLLWDLYRKSRAEKPPVQESDTISTTVGANYSSRHVGRDANQE